MNGWKFLRVALVLGLFAGGFLALTVSSYVQESATWDEPSHVVAGYSMLKLGDYRFSPDHLPLPRMWEQLQLEV